MTPALQARKELTNGMPNHKNLVSTRIAPLLRDAGFAKKGSTWNKSGSAGVFVLNLQSSQVRRDGSIDATINLGIMLEDVWKLCWGKVLPDFVKEEHCYPRFRVGDLLADFSSRSVDKWWKIGGADSPSAEGEILEVVSEVSLPFFDQMKSRSEVASFVTEKIKDRFPLDKLHRALLLGLEGEDVSSVFALLEKDDYWGSFAKAARQRLEDATGGQGSPASAGKA